MKKPKKVIGWFLIVVSIGYLLLATFSTQKETSKNHAQTASANGGSNSLVAQATESTNVTLKNNSENPSISAPANSGNLAIQIGGTNNSVTQSVVNMGSRPEISIIPRSLNVETNIIGFGRAYVTTLLIRIHNPPTGRFTLKYTLDGQKLLSVSRSSSPAGLIEEAGFLTMESWVVTFVTAEEVKQSDFHFSIEPYAP